MSVSENIDNVVDARRTLMYQWLHGVFPKCAFTVHLLTGDASFRRYFRVHVDNQTFVVMDAPPEKENCEPFIAIASAFENASVRFPKIISKNLVHGFLLLSDFGDQQLLPLLNQESASELYFNAMTTLLQIQQGVTPIRCSERCLSVTGSSREVCEAGIENPSLQGCIHGVLPLDCLTRKQKRTEKVHRSGATPIQQCNHISLPNFDDALYWREFDIFDQWYLQRNLGKHLPSSDENQLCTIYQLLIDSAHEQPSVFVHRDYHSRNIMLCRDGKLGILDFQDAVIGPITYDLVSLLRDCYVAWPIDQTEKWVFDYYQQLNFSVDFKTFLRWFDLMGLQRHLKCLGIFSRLYFRDGKAGYLKEMPRVLGYVNHVCERYPEFFELKRICNP